jgi:hypothetical protein
VRVERYRRRDILEMDGKRQRGTDREEETTTYIVFGSKHLSNKKRFKIRVLLGF